MNPSINQDFEFRINYLVTPPQANNLEEVLQLLYQIHQDGFADVKRWLSHLDSEYFSNKTDSTLNRHFQYHLNACRWLGLITPKNTKPFSKGVELTKSGYYFVELDPLEGMKFLKRLLLKDEVFSAFSENNDLENSQLITLLVAKIMSPESKWRNSKGNILSLATARRRASCAIAWGRLLGI